MGPVFLSQVSTQARGGSCILVSGVHSGQGWACILLSGVPFAFIQPDPHTWFHAEIVGSGKHMYM